MAGLSIAHLLIFAVVVLLLFGTSKLKHLGRDLGGVVKDFKKSVHDEEKQPTDPQLIEHEKNQSSARQQSKTQLES